ncbi:MULTISPECIES: VTT domain-containing protein [unclassified Brachybacterium]|uniref:DedA family protein n=1 Tax=unclassified Brachybacterium TaxID=2623841 RepID=UPI003619D9B6
MGGFIDWLLSLSGQIEEWILAVADAWWVHLVVYAFAALDGFFPTVPSESTIVTLSSLWASSGRPSIILIGLAAWLGAWSGDNLGYLLGNKVGWERFRFLREGKGRRAVDAADRGLQRRALLFLMTARYIPFGRTAVNLVAGAVHYPHRKFWPRSLLSTFVWAVYSCAIGVVAGSWFEDNHLMAITVALVAAGVLALVVERAINTVHRVLDRRAERRGDAVRDRVGEDDDSGDAAGTDEDTDPEQATDRRDSPALTDSPDPGDNAAPSDSPDALGSADPRDPGASRDSPGSEDPARVPAREEDRPS